MGHSRIDPVLRRRVRRRAKGLCEYCLYPQDACYAVFHCDHYLPESKGGKSVARNLVWACPTCNASKASLIDATDPQTGRRVAIFNPRHDAWDDHFAWSADRLRILGKTAVGRATVRALRMNRRATTVIRVMLLELGIHPGARQ